MIMILVVMIVVVVMRMIAQGCRVGMISNEQIHAKI